jgi:hypothetical protein
VFLKNRQLKKIERIKKFNERNTKGLSHSLVGWLDKELNGRNGTHTQCEHIIITSEREEER